VGLFVALQYALAVPLATSEKSVPPTATSYGVEAVPSTLIPVVA
jgi:hypothetical protein